MDVEMPPTFAELFKPVSTSDPAPAVDAIADVGPGGHFLGTRNTINRFDNAFHTLLLSDWSNSEHCRERRVTDAARRSHRVCKETLAACEPSALDRARLDAIDALIARRTAEGGADYKR